MTSPQSALPTHRVDVEAMAAYCRGRHAYHEVFPWFYEAVRDGVLSQVRPRYPDADAIIGTSALGMESTLAKFPGEVKPLEWVAFSFGEIPLHDFHIGVVLDLEHWPATYILGLHIMDDVMPQFGKMVGTIDWPPALGGTPEFHYEAQVRENRWIDPTRDINFADLPAEVDHIIDRVVRYYLVAAPITL